MALIKNLSFSRGRKRILISNNSCNLEKFRANCESHALIKRRCNEEEEDSSLLEALPEEILIKVVCGVDHDDLKQLFHVSKTVRNATIIAKQSHFAYSTPSKTKAFKNPFDLSNDSINFDDCRAPKQDRRMNRPRISKKKLEDITIALFSEGTEEQRWPRRSLFMEL